jgi:hypothetical protein
MGFEGSAGQMNRIHERTRIMYKKEQFVFHLFSMQSILYLHNPYLHTQDLSIHSERYPSPSPPQIYLTNPE